MIWEMYGVSPVPTVSTNKDGIVTVELGENQTIKINSNENYGNVEITISCAGKMATCLVTIQAPPPSAGVPETTRDTAKEIPYNWDEIAELAGVISKKVGTITNDTEEVVVSINGVSDTLRVGDFANVDGKVVRILGFNHDELSDSEKETAYGGGCEYAGISFEYVDPVMSNSSFNNGAIPSDGWASCTIRETLNSIVFQGLEDNVQVNIKTVKKPYSSVPGDTNLSYIDDKLWLLSYEEVFGDGVTIIGEAYRSTASSSIEGMIYKFYSVGEAYQKGVVNSCLVKPSSANGDVKAFQKWLLRSFDNIPTKTYNCAVTNQRAYLYALNNNTAMICPGFSI